MLTPCPAWFKPLNDQAAAWATLLPNVDLSHIPTLADSISRYSEFAPLVIVPKLTHLAKQWEITADPFSTEGYRNIWRCLRLMLESTRPCDLQPLDEDYSLVTLLPAVVDILPELESSTPGDALVVAADMHAYTKRSMEEIRHLPPNELVLTSAQVMCLLRVMPEMLVAGREDKFIQCVGERWGGETEDGSVTFNYNNDFSEAADAFAEIVRSSPSYSASKRREPRTASLICAWQRADVFEAQDGAAIAWPPAY